MEFLAFENNLVRITLTSFKINGNTATLRFFYLQKTLISNNRENSRTTLAKQGYRTLFSMIHTLGIVDQILTCDQEIDGQTGRPHGRLRH